MRFLCYIALLGMVQGCAAVCEDQCRARRVIGKRPDLATVFAGARLGEAAPVRLSRVLPSGGRAVSLRVESTGAPVGWIRPDDKVDVVLLATAPSGATVASIVLMQNARVLGVVRSGKRPDGPYRLTLLALAAEAQALLLASRRGRFAIFLRNPTDQQVGHGRAITVRQLEDPAFWRRHMDKRMRTLQHPGKPPPTCIPRSKRVRDIAL